MYRRSTPPGNRARPKRGPLLLLLLCLVIVAVFVVLVVMDNGRNRYANNSCLNGSAIPRAHTIVVIDQTSALSDQQLLYVKGVILREYRRLKEQDRLTLTGLRTTKVDAAGESGPPLFYTTCRIPRGDEVSIFSNNPRMVERQFDILVGESLAAFINGLRSVPEAKWSPIVETIEGVPDNPLFSSPAIARRLVLISDMIQNTPGNSQYAGKAHRGAPKAHPMQLMRASLSGVDVRVHYIFREGLDATQNPEHEAFWEHYFAAAGVASLQIGWGLPLNDTEDRIDPIKWSEAPVLPVPPAPTPVVAPRPQRDVAPAPGNPLLPGKILVHGTRHAGSGAAPAFVNYEINWRRLDSGDYLVFDARRLLLLTSRQDDRECYISVPLVSKIARDSSRLGPGRSTHRLDAYEQAEQNFVQRLAANVGTTFEPANCEIVGARIVNSKDTGPRYRALRCTQSDFINIQEEGWVKFAHVTAPGVVASRLAVVSGHQQLPAPDVARIAQTLREKSVCPAEPLASLESKLLLGLQWLDARVEPASNRTTAQQAHTRTPVQQAPTRKIVEAAPTPATVETDEPDTY